MNRDVSDLGSASLKLTFSAVTSRINPFKDVFISVLYTFYLLSEPQSKIYNNPCPKT